MTGERPRGVIEPGNIFWRIGDGYGSFSLLLEGGGRKCTVCKGVE
jgi:hypothetical protein